MRYMITAALALCLLGGAASAQDREHGRGGEGRREGGPGAYRQAPTAPQVGQTRGFRGGPQQAAPQAAAPQAAPTQSSPRFEGRGDRGGDRRDFRGSDRGGERYGDRGRDRGFDRRDEFRGGRSGFDRRGPEPGYRPGYWARDHGWRGGGHFRAPSYRYPSGFGYQRWSFGAFLPGVFLAPDYLIGSYWTYGLPAPPPGYHWIRVGPDALLVRYGDGYVLDVVYDIFY